ncbi:STAS domain-containing protein [Planotetraspora phitsanulokensis]|uniref:STAS domain-containing protein n=1 Tax=Planotetraspora phitsanulokensis TaxID=575192 RepID=UPI00194F06DB|nr:STAS domain-containing protein [Planotetraspora phitsanulokensis]
MLYLDRYLRVTYSPRTGLIRLVGELDASNAPAVAETLAHAKRSENVLVIDTAQLDFIDLAGLRMLIRLCSDGSARLSAMPPRMLRLIHLLDQAHTLRAAE